MSDISDFNSKDFSRGGALTKSKRPRKGRHARPIFRDVDGEPVLRFPAAPRRVAQQQALAHRALAAWAVFERHWSALPPDVQRAASELMAIIRGAQL